MLEIKGYLSIITLNKMLHKGGKVAKVASISYPSTPIFHSILNYFPHHHACCSKSRN